MKHLLCNNNQDKLEEQTREIKEKRKKLLCLLICLFIFQEFHWRIYCLIKGA